ncbi:MAG TPA: hypothetical protein VHP83_15470 [Aggregatilineaceae bacterium]|nr:hypothetical protein [Aggregatilineaceae bacterium]
MKRTLQLTFPFGQTLLLAGVILMGLAGLLEGAARLPAIQAHLPEPSWSTSFPDLETRLRLLDDYPKPVNCFFVGSSVAAVDVQPDVVALAYQKQHQEPINCFNFGVSTLTPAQVVLVVDYLVERYHPRLIIYVLSPRDLSPEANPVADRVPDLRDFEWLTYYQGEWSWNGWLINHSEAYRRFNGYREPEVNMMSFQKNGYQPAPGVMALPLEQRWQDRLDALFTDFAPVEAELDAVQRLMRQDGAHMVLVEAPFHRIILDGYLRDDAYTRLNDQLRALAEAEAVPYWTTSTLDIFADDSFRDPIHLNPTGAAIFSQWLGEQIG